MIQGPMQAAGQPINRLALVALTSSRDPEDHCRSALRHFICNRTSLRTLRHQTRRDVGALLRRPNHCRSQLAPVSPKWAASRHRRNLPRSIFAGVRLRLASLREGEVRSSHPHRTTFVSLHFEAHDSGTFLPVERSSSHQIASWILPTCAKLISHPVSTLSRRPTLCNRL